jgi:hypothetical protein
MGYYIVPNWDPPPVLPKSDNEDLECSLTFIIVVYLGVCRAEGEEGKIR